MVTRIAEGLAALGQPNQTNCAEQLAEYGRLLLAGNQVMNLTAITDPLQVADLHMLDCAALLNYVNFEHKTLIDVGTGAGFPGLVLKILVPTLTVTLLDSQKKRLNWLNQTIAALNLTGVTTLHSRAEDAAHSPAFRQGFHFSTARAVAELRVLSELCLPFLRPDGIFLAMKSVESEQELSAAEGAVEKLGGSLAGVQDYCLPNTEVRHRLILIRKTRDTPEKYPRRWSKIQKSPLV